MILEKIFGKLKVLVVILFVIVVSLVAFWGVFSKEKGVWRNVILDYQYGMELQGARELQYALNDSEEEKYVYVDENGDVKGEVWKKGNPITAEEETTASENSEEIASEELPYAKETRNVKVNSDDKLTKENFEIAKKIIQKRLKNQEIAESNLRIDDVTGDLMVETANNDTVELVENLVSSAGKFQIIDYQNGLILMDNKDIKNVSVVSSNEAYQTYLQIEFNKEGAEKLREISTKYIEIKDDTQPEENESDEHNEDETEKRYVSIVLDDTTMMTTYFGEEMTNGMLQISVGQDRTNYKEFLEDYRSAKSIADILNSGVMPVTYELKTDNFVKSEYTQQDKKMFSIIAIFAIIIVSFMLTVKFKKNGALGAVLAIGYIAVLSIVTRYTNVILTENSVITYVLVIVMNYVFMKLLLKNLQTQEIEIAYRETAKKFYLALIPVDVIILVFTFSKYTIINSIGMILFWGILLNGVYNFIFTRMVLKKQN